MHTFTDVEKVQFPKYLLQACGAEDLFADYVDRLVSQLQISLEAAIYLVSNYRALDILDQKDNLLIIRKYNVYTAIAIDNLDQALGCIVSLKDENVYMLYLTVSGVKQDVMVNTEKDIHTYILKPR